MTNKEYSFRINAKLIDPISNKEIITVSAKAHNREMARLRLAACLRIGPSNVCDSIPQKIGELKKPVSTVFKKGGFTNPSILR